MRHDSEEHGRMQDFVEALLIHEGALVEPIDPEGLEVIAPPSVQRALGVGELARLGFGATLPPMAQRVGMEGDWLDRFAGLLGGQGRWTRRILSVSAKTPSDPERVLGHELVLDNATYRLLGVAPAWTRYLVMDFRASAVSDDKRDFMPRVGINLATGALPDAILAALGPAIDRPGFDSALDDQAAPEPTDLPPIWDRARVIGLLSRALPPRLDAALYPFIKGMRRRLARDEDRLHHYHNDLYHEAMRRMSGLPEADPKHVRERQRAEAISREYRAKLDDLARQYATRVTVEWVQTLELVMPVYRFTVQIRRRKADRTIALDWNPLARRLEPPVCEATLGTERPRFVCDDALHLVVPAGLGPCENCGKAYCRACHPGNCPKCGAKSERPSGIIPPGEPP
jgi:hypothetical protein